MITGGILVVASEEGWEQLNRKKYMFAMAKVDKLTTSQVQTDYLKRIARIPKLKSFVKIFLGKFLW